MKKTIALVFSMIFICLLLFGCSSKSKDIIGKYEYAAWTVLINEDMTYRVYKTSSGETIKEGKWLFDSSKSVLTFNQFTDDNEDVFFVENNGNFILLDKNKIPCFYDDLLLESGNVLNFTYKVDSLDLKFCATGDIEITGDNFEYGDGTYEIKGNKVYAYYSYTKASARNYANGEMYFYIYNKKHIIPYNYIMIKT